MKKSIFIMSIRDCWLGTFKKDQKFKIIDESIGGVRAKDKENREYFLDREEFKYITTNASKIKEKLGVK